MVIVGFGDGLMVRSNDLVPVALAVSVTRTVKVNVPAAVGVPLSTPPVLSESPPGAAPPTIAQLVYGVVPPVAANVCVYATPTVPAGNGDAVVIVGGPATVKEKTLVATTPALSGTLTVKLKVPDAVGVPLNTPAALRESPGGAPGVVQAP